MISPATLALFVAPAIGLGFAAALFLFTAVVDKRALRRADRLEGEIGRRGG
jgi:hypothetical protein